MLVLIPILLYAGAFALAQQSDNFTTGESVSFQPSHLSPLLHYTPALVPNHTDPRTGWVTTWNSTYTHMPNASVRWSYWGDGSVARGVGRYLNVTVDNDTGIGRYTGDGRKLWGYWPDAESVDTWTSEGYLFYTQEYREGPPIQSYNVSIKTQESGNLSAIHISRLEIFTGLPTWNNDRYMNYSYVSAAGTDGSRDTSVFDDPQNAWNVVVPNFNNSRPLRWAGHYSYSASRKWNERTAATQLNGRPDVLASSTRGAPLRFTAPDNTSLVSILGTVGPNQGAFELRLLPRTPLTNFNPHPLVLKGTAERPINAIGEIKSVAWLDPRVKHDLELMLTEEGKQVDLHGVQFMRAMTGGKLQEPLEEWWVRENASRGFGNSSGRGLSGGAIAGIVVGSVVGAVLIAGALYLLCRSRRKSRTSDPFKDRPMKSP